MQTLSASPSSDHPFGNVLASGNGKGYYQFWIAALLLGGVIVGFFCFFTPAKIRKECCCATINEYGQIVFGQIRPDACETCEKMVQCFFWSGIVVFFILMLDTLYVGSFIRRTEITVYENGITGRGVGIYFWWIRFSRLPRFQLTYDRLSRVDATGKAITVYAEEAVYVCYVKNPVEMQRIIIEQERKVKFQNETSNKERANT